MQALPPERQPDWPTSKNTEDLLFQPAASTYLSPAARIWKCLKAKQKRMKVTLAGIVKADGHGMAEKVAVFGLLKRNGKVYTVAVPNTQTATLLPIIRK